MEELFNKGKSLSNNIHELCGIVQNSGMIYTREDIDMFDDGIKELIKQLGVWKMDVIMYCEGKMESETDEL